jgi:ribosomal protein S18 acetylase RimI-like enzyme
MTTFDIRPAEPAELDTLMDLYQQTRQWLWSRGIQQWTAPDGNDPAFLARIRASFAGAIEAGECYVATADGELAGALIVDERADPEFWTANDEPASALYVHRMIAARTPAARGVGAALLEKAAAVALAKGRHRLRLDAWQTNTALHRYYERHGFTHLRTLPYTHRGSGALFERDLTTTP